MDISQVTVRSVPTNVNVRLGQLAPFWTRVGEAPERIYVSDIALEGDWHDWKAGEPKELLRPEFPYEGADEPLEPSFRGPINVRVNQLRDPAIFEEDGRAFLLYAVAGESGIALAEVFPGCD